MKSFCRWFCDWSFEVGLVKEDEINKVYMERWMAMTKCPEFSHQGKNKSNQMQLLYSGER